MKRNGTHRWNCRCPDCRPTGAENRHPASGSRDWRLLGYKLSTRLLLSIVMMLCLVVVAVAAGAVGYKLGMDDGYGWQATSSIEFHFQPNTSTFPTYVHRKGNYTVGGYTFVLGTDRLPQLAGKTTGYAPPGGPIYIHTDRPLLDVYETCVHEKLHRTPPFAPHRWIYDVQDRVVDDTCLRLIHRLR